VRACMVAYSFYDSDNRVRRYAECLVRHGHQVDVISLRPRGEKKIVKRNGVTVYRIQERTINENGKTQYLSRLLKFLFLSVFYLMRNHNRKPYQLIHVHSIPDFEVFSALVPKLSGARVILDIHDIVPEYYASKFGVRHNSTIFRLLVLMERLSAGFADHVIIANHIWQETLLKRSVKKDKCTTILNYPDPIIFSGRSPGRQDDAIVFLYPGSLNWHQGLDIAVKAFSRIKDEIPNARFDIYGDGSAANEIRDLIQERGLQGRVFLKESVNMESVAVLMARADIGIVPKRNDPFGGNAFSTKTLEFMLSKTPLILSKTRIDDVYFDDSVVMFFEPENEKDLAQCMLRLAKDKPMRQRLAEAGYRFAERMSWNHKENIYLELIDDLMRREKGWSRKQP
jgi:glycosyltransferase involved in cell wall biosynthesis